MVFKVAIWICVHYVQLKRLHTKSQAKRTEGKKDPIIVL